MHSQKISNGLLSILLYQSIKFLFFISNNNPKPAKIEIILPAKFILSSLPIPHELLLSINIIPSKNKKTSINNNDILIIVFFCNIIIITPIFF